MQKVEHIGIAVYALTEASMTYSKIFGLPPYKEERVETEGVATAFFQIGETKIELLEGLNPESPIAKFIAKRGEGIHHIAYAVDDIETERARLINEGFEPIGGIRNGADDKLVCFFHPKSTHGVLMELCQDRPK
jgi:methylmalonyl-CoA/ethylmalonyl-CoA epimerase